MVVLKRRIWGLPWTIVVQGMPPGVVSKGPSNRASAMCAVMIQGIYFWEQWGGIKMIGIENKRRSVFTNVLVLYHT